MELDDNKIKALILIVLFLALTIIFIIGINVGFWTGTYTQENIMLYEINVRDLKLQDKICIVNNNTHLLGFCPELCNWNNELILKKYDNDYDNVVIENENK